MVLGQLVNNSRLLQAEAFLLPDVDLDRFVSLVKAWIKVPSLPKELSLNLRNQKMPNGVPSGRRI